LTLSSIPVSDTVFYRPMPQKVVDVVHRAHILCIEARMGKPLFGVFSWIHCSFQERERERERVWGGGGEAEMNKKVSGTGGRRASFQKY
jgi:hypothetical protein